MMTQRTVLVLSDWRPVRDITNFHRKYTAVHHVRASRGFLTGELMNEARLLANRRAGKMTNP
jgi:predicted ABC-class ATPase